MEEPQRSIAFAGYERVCKGWEATLDRTRANLDAGADMMDVIAAEGALLLGSEGQTMPNLAFTVASLMVREAQLSPRAKGARKAAVPAKRKTRAQMLKEAAEVNADTLARLAERSEAKKTGPIEHGPHPLEGEE